MCIRDRVAASVLEVQPTQAKRKVTLVGIGIGTPEGMTVEAAQVIEKADLLVGACLLYTSRCV